MSDGGPWMPAAEGARSKTVTVTSLDPYVGYRFRTTAVNAVGTSPPGPESVPMLPDNEHVKEHAKIGEPPSVTATSSASVVLAWASSPCRPQLMWELLYTRHGGTSGGEWHTIASRVSGTSYEAQSIRCPTGCSFRVRPLELKNLAEFYSRSSPVVRTKTLPRAQLGALRLELKFLASPSEPSRDNLISSRIAADLATAVGVSSSRVAIVEVRGQGRYVIFDFLPGGEPTPVQLGDELVGAIGDMSSLLYAGEVTASVDPSMPPLMVAHNGTVTPLVLNKGDAISRLAVTITTGFAFCACLCVALALFARAVCPTLAARAGRTSAGRSRRTKRFGTRKASYGRVRGDHEADNYDDDFDEDGDDIIEREARRLETY